MSDFTVKNAKDLNLRKELPKGIRSSVINDLKAEIQKLSHDIALKDIFVIFNDVSIYLAGFKLQLFSKNSYDIYLWKTNEDAIIDIYSKAGDKSDEKKCVIADEIKQILSFILYESFQIRKSHKVSMYPYTYRMDLINGIQNAGFIKEGYIRDRYFKDNEFNDCFVYSMLSDEFARLSTGYVKLLNTTIKVRATEYSVFEVSVSNDRNLIFPDNISEKNVFHDELAYDNLKYIIKQLVEYDSGIRKVFDFHSEFYEATDFQKKIWKLNSTIPYGQTLSYEALASMLFENDKRTHEEIDKSAKNFSRAVGVALSKNPIMILIPCHRVIGKDGKLVGFAGGIELKDSLLMKEMLYYK